MGEDARLVIATPPEAALVEEIHSRLPRFAVRYEPELLPLTCYRGDHRGTDDANRTADEQSRWETMLLDAEASLGIPGDDPQQLNWLVRHSNVLRFVQATAVGAGEQVEAAGVSAEDLERVAVARSSGVHAGPLAEFAPTGILDESARRPAVKSEARY